jgi:hypothetical protein
MKKMRIGRYMVPVWILSVLLISIIGVGAIAGYVWETLNIPVQVNEPLKILGYPSKFNLYPGDTEKFNISLQNSASNNYSMVLDFSFSNSTYQSNYVSFSNTIYTIVPGKQNITAWFSVSSDAPPISDTLSIGFERVESTVLYSSGLIGYWKLDEGSGNVVMDSSGYGNNGTIYGATWVPGKVGYALNFDGVDDYVSIPSFTPYNVTSLTVAAWIDSPLTQIGYIFYNGENGEFVLHMGQRVDAGAGNPNLASFSVKFGSVGWVDVFSNSVTPNTWHYIVGVWTMGESIKIYVDGVLEGENTAIPNESLYNPGSAYIATIGTYYDLIEHDYFQGSIQGIRIYNRALNNTEISDLYSIPP